MKWILVTAWRESARSRGRLFAMLSSMILGVAAMVALTSFCSNLRSAIDEQARTLLGADLMVLSRRPLTDEQRQFIEALPGERATEVSFSTMAVAPKSQEMRLVQLSAFEGAYPFYGEFETSPAGAMTKLRGEGEAIAIVDEALLAQFGLKVGEQIRVAGREYRIDAMLQRAPGEIGLREIVAPRILVNDKTIDRSTLLGAGSRASYKTYLRTEGVDAEALKERFKERLLALQLTLESVQDKKDSVGKPMERVFQFISLMSTLALILGSLGVASAVHVYAVSKIPVVAVLRFVGASPWQAAGVFLAQIAVAALAASAVGAGLGLLVQQGLPAIFAETLPVDVAISISWFDIAVGLLAGMTAAVVFSAVPLAALRQISPLACLRPSDLQSMPKDRLRWMLWVLIFVLGGAFVALQTRAPKVAIGYTVGVSAVLVILLGLGALLRLVSRRIASRTMPYPIRQGVANLARPFNQTQLLSLSIGVTTFLLVLISLLQSGILLEFEKASTGDQPNLILFDIQDDQRESIAKLLAEHQLMAAEPVPVVTMRLTSVRGVPVSELMDEEKSGIPTWTLKREYRNSYRATLSGTEKIVAGELKTASDGDDVSVSIEKGLAEKLKVGLGDSVEFDLQGVPIAAKIGSIRDVNWNRIHPNFFFVFPPGVLEDAPKFFMLATRAGTPEQSGAFQRALIRQHPNVSVIDARMILSTLNSLIEQLSWVVRFLSVFTLGTAIVVLVGSISLTRFSRRGENALLKTLGATRTVILKIAAAEYSAVSGAAAVSGALLAASAYWAISFYVFSVPPTLLWQPLAIYTALSTAVAVLFGVVGASGVFKVSAMEVLREE